MFKTYLSGHINIWEDYAPFV